MKNLESLRKRNPHLTDKEFDSMFNRSKNKINKGSKIKDSILILLNDFCLTNNYTLELEHKFSTKRRFKFDYAIMELKIAVEYEGLMSAKSRHTTVSGFSRDTQKYNLAINNGWKVFRYTAMTYNDLKTDLETINSNNGK